MKSVNMLTFERVEVMKLWRVYKMYCDTTPGVVYVGITSQSLKSRLTQHLCDSKNHWKIMWLDFLKKQGVEPLIKEITTLYGTKQDAEKLEQFFINFHKSTGHTLINVTIRSK